MFQLFRIFFDKFASAVPQFCSLTTLVFRFDRKVSADLYGAKLWTAFRYAGQQLKTAATWPMQR